MSLGSIGSSTANVYTRATATAASTRAASASANPTKSASQVTYQDHCGDTVNLQGIVVADRNNPENVGQAATMVCNPRIDASHSSSSDNQAASASDPIQQKLNAAYSRYAISTGVPTST